MYTRQHGGENHIGEAIEKEPKTEVYAGKENKVYPRKEKRSKKNKIYAGNVKRGEAIEKITKSEREKRLKTNPISSCVFRGIVMRIASSEAQ